MATIDTPKRILADDYPQEDRETIEKLGSILNYFMEQTTNTVNGRLDFENLNRQLIEIAVNINTDGTPIRVTQFVANQGIVGINIIRAVNTTNAVNFPTGAPFITFTSNGQGTYTIQHITGLRPGENFTLSLELIF